MKKNLKKMIALAMSVMLMVSCFSGCGKNQTDKDEQGRTIISVGGYPVAEGESKKNFDRGIKKFMDKNPDAHVVGDTYAIDLTTLFTKGAAGQLPTVFETPMTEVSTCITSGYIRDITDAGKKYGFYDAINPMLKDGVVERDGVLYGIPRTIYALGLAFNANLFKEAGLVNPDGSYMVPKTWEEVAEYAVQIKEKTGKAGFVTPTINRCGGWLFTPIAWSYGVEFMKQDKDGKWKATFDSQEMVDALQFYKDLRWKYDVLPPNVLLDNGPAEQELLVGNAGMMLRAPSYMDNAVSGYGIGINDIGIMEIPAGPKKHVTLLGGSVVMLAENATDDQVDVGMRWISTLTTPKLTEEYKSKYIDSLDLKVKQGNIIGVIPLKIWNEGTEVVKFEREEIAKRNNIDIRNVQSYNDFASGKSKNKIEIQPEEPMCAQELYAILDQIIQAVLTDKNADCAKLVKDAAKDFQRDYLDFVS